MEVRPKGWRAMIVYMYIYIYTHIFMYMHIQVFELSAGNIENDNASGALE